MKIKHTLILAFLLCSVSLIAQDKSAPKSDDDIKQATGQPSEAEMAVWMKYMTPGDMHKLLASQNGDWNVDLTFWTKADVPPTKSKATCKNTMIFGDRYQESIHTGEIMGMPFEGKSLCGYDNAKKTFQSTWIDNMGSGIMYLEGKYDLKSKTINFSGYTVDPATGKSVGVREVFKFIDEKNQLLQMYMTTDDGGEFKNMEIKFTKKS